MRHKIDYLVKKMRSPGPKGAELLKKALEFAEKSYGENKTNFDRAWRIAAIVAELGLGSRSISAALLEKLPDNMEENIKAKLGSDIHFLIKGVKILDKASCQEKENCADGIMKFFLANAKDLRVIVIKIAKHLEALRRTNFFSPESRRLASESMALYAPLSDHLGIGIVTRELQKLSFKILNPKAYEYTSKVLEIKEKKEKKKLMDFKKVFLKNLAGENIKIRKAEIRLKSEWSVWEKLKKKGRIGKIYDIKALRLNVESVPDCYRALDIVHKYWTPIQGRIKDYIAFPKPNGYQSLHTTVSIGKEDFVEIQIRTPDMDERANYGIASHDDYKRGNLKINQWFRTFFPPPRREKEAGHPSSKNVPEWIKSLVDVESYISLKAERDKNKEDSFLPGRILVLGKNGEVVDLPKDATVIDFAFAFDPKTATHLAGAKVNGKFVSIDKKLNNGDTVELQTKKNAFPREKWFSSATTPLAHNFIKKYLSGHKVSHA